MLLHFWIGANVLRSFNVVILVQVAIVLYHIVAAFSKAHYAADLIVALLNYPVIIACLYWRRKAIEVLSVADSPAKSM